MTVNRDLLNIIACPVCKNALERDPGEEALICPVCAVRYPVRDGIPLLLAEQAKPLDPQPESAAEKQPE